MKISAISLAIAVQIAAVLLLSEGASADGDPHWNKGTCQVCHETVTPAVNNLGLTAESTEQLCDTCHGSRGDARPCRHTSGILVDEQNVGEGHRAYLREGQLVCTTCHDVAYQCAHPVKSYSFMNPGFLRDRKSPQTSEYCYQCHSRLGYERLNPHVVEAGDPPQPTCLLCHANLPVQGERGWLAVDFNMQESLNDVCLGCHTVRPHPGNSFSGKPVGWEHLAVPSAEVTENMQQAEVVRGIILPVDPYNGEVHCATCHNPHHDQLEGYSVADPPGSDHRLRVEKICQACHDK